MKIPSILENIVNRKIGDIQSRKNRLPFTEIEQLASSTGPPLNLAGALMGEKVRLIAEIKKASPSKGIMSPQFDPAVLARRYAQNGAAAVSVLTEENYFMGHLEDIGAVKQAIGDPGLPILCKDFIFDPYQILEAKAYGADAILLIVAMLDKSKLRELIHVCQEQWIQALVEVHNETEMDHALSVGAEIIGINHRNLDTFNVDMSVSTRLRPMVPHGKILVAESGIDSYEQVAAMKAIGMNAILVGEALVTAADVEKKVRDFSSV